MCGGGGGEVVSGSRVESVVFSISLNTIYNDKLVCCSSSRIVYF